MNDNAELMEEINKLKERGRYIIVEGKKDKMCLEGLGIDGGRIIMLDKRPLYEVVEEAVRRGIKEVALLTDMDKEGKKLFGTLNSNLGRLGVRVNNGFRNFLLKETKLRQIEGMGRYLEKGMHKLYKGDNSK